MDTSHQQKEGARLYHTTLLLRHDVHPDLIADKLRYHFALITAMFFSLTIQRIVQSTSPQRMNVGARCKNYG